MYVLFSTSIFSLDLEDSFYFCHKALIQWDMKLFRQQLKNCRFPEDVRGKKIEIKTYLPSRYTINIPYLEYTQRDRKNIQGTILLCKE